MSDLPKWSRRLVGLAALALLLGGGRAEAGVITVQPADARGIRQFPGLPPTLLTFLSVNASVEDRTVLLFDLAALAGSPPGPVNLRLPLQNLDPGGPEGVIDVFTFPGTGAVTPGQFAAGTLFTSVGNNGSGVAEVDVTAAVQAALDAGQPSLGFRLSTATGDRFLLGPPLTPAGPTLVASGAAIPEPSALTLLGLGGLVLVWRGRRRAGRN